MTPDAVAALSFELVSDFSPLPRLRPEWDALWQRTGAPAYLSFACAAVAFETCRQFPGERLHCLVGRAALATDARPQRPAVADPARMPRGAPTPPGRR